jgi:uncharacterized metal-binding protein
MAVDCADCTSFVCRTGQIEALPDNCPMRDELPDFSKLYAKSLWREMAYCSALVEAEGYGHWPRVREIAEFSRRMGFRRLGIAHCPATSTEARLAQDYLTLQGLEAVLPPETGCEPEEQARFFEQKATELNIICGMCTGHDSIFIRASSAPVTLLIVQDLKLQHNPAAALCTSNSYFRKALYREHQSAKSPSSHRGFSKRELETTSRQIADEGRGNWCRVEEVIELARRLGAERLGVVFCSGFRSEAHVLKRVLVANGFSVSSSCFKTGSVPKEEFGIRDSQKVRPGSPEMICNPIAQAELLNREKVHLALLLGQCVGHDSATMARLKAPVVGLVAKDRAMGHNPAAALYRFEHGKGVGR